MGSFYRLSIQCDTDQRIRIDEILGKSISEPALGWDLIIEESSDQFVNALNLFINLISHNLNELKKIAITPQAITIWYMYEYEQQCNMEFTPQVTKKLGDLGIVLCVSCWEK